MFTPVPAASGCPVARASTQTLKVTDALPLSAPTPQSSRAQRQTVFDSVAQLLWSEAVRVAWEHRGLPNVVEPEVQHDDSLHAHASPAMRRRTQLEGIYIRTNCFRFDVVHFGSLLQKLGQVYSLSTGYDLLQVQPTSSQCVRHYALQLVHKPAYMGTSAVPY